MLVLSRRQNQKFVFPNLGITIEILSVKGRLIRVGVTAPADVKVLRAELAGPEQNTQVKPPNHRLRNRLHTANLAVHLARKQMKSGFDSEAEKSLEEALAHFEAIERELEPAAEKPPVRNRLNALSALLVEDDANESELLAAFLRLSGVEVETATDGTAALNYLGMHRPDVVLLDMFMPRCDGATTVTAIRQDPKLSGLKVFAVSGTSPSALGVPTGPEGVDGWFAKPLNPVRLVREMTEVFSRS